MLLSPEVSHRLNLMRSWIATGRILCNGKCLGRSRSPTRSCRKLSCAKWARLSGKQSSNIPTFTPESPGAEGGGGLQSVRCDDEVSLKDHISSSVSKNYNKKQTRNWINWLEDTTRSKKMKIFSWSWNSGKIMLFFRQKTPLLILSSSFFIAEIL